MKTTFDMATEDMNRVCAVLLRDRQWHEVDWADGRTTFSSASMDWFRWLERGREFSAPARAIDGVQYRTAEERSR